VNSRPALSVSGENAPKPAEIRVAWLLVSYAMLKMDVTSETQSATLLTLAGKISVDHLPDLARLLDEAVHCGRRVGVMLSP
jgi:hypothetical protein